VRKEAIQSAALAFERASGDLASLASDAEQAIGPLTAGFEELDAQTKSILGLAFAIVQSIENEGVRSALPKVRALGVAARGYASDRLRATNGILESVTAEATLLGQLSGVARSQSAIALRTRVLTMLTNIEVGRLGTQGAGFHYLATELARFSMSLTEETEQLTLQTEERKPAIEAAKRALSAELPYLKEEFARIDLKLEEDLVELEAGLTQITDLPLQFRTGVEEIAAQVAGVIAAIQSYDITRQQIEHVQEALTSMCIRMREAGKRGNSQVVSMAYAGVTIQISQLRNTKLTVAHWTAQIESCMDAILRVCASGLGNISPLVLEQDRIVRSRLADVDLLEQQGQDYSRKIRTKVGGNTGLVQFLALHVEKSNAVRQLLHLLSLNSIVEADHLGTRANAILEIGNGISGLSLEWGQIADRSDRALKEIAALVAQTGQLMETFSDTGDAALRQAQKQTRSGMDGLRSVAVAAAIHEQEIVAVKDKMRAASGRASQSSVLLQASYARIDAILDDIEQVKLLFETDYPDAGDGFDADEMAAMFSASYTTQVERDVLHAALHGTAPPLLQQDLGGNGIELF
jgi:hypothetical protein